MDIVGLHGAARLQTAQGFDVGGQNGNLHRHQNAPVAARNAAYTDMRAAETAAIRQAVRLGLLAGG
ncbi:hypothetical protein MASR1M42_07250 [Azonexus hydrophilus]